MRYFIFISFALVGLIAMPVFAITEINFEGVEMEIAEREVMILGRYSYIAKTPISGGYYEVHEYQAPTGNGYMTIYYDEKNRVTVTIGTGIEAIFLTRNFDYATSSTTQE